MRTLLLLALLLSLPRPATAQLDPAPERPRVSISAFSGVRAPYTTGFVTLFDAEGSPLFSVSEQRGGNALLGVEAEVRVTGPLSLLVGGAYSQGGISDFFVDREAAFRDTADFRIRMVDETLFAKLGASVRLEAPRRAGETRPGPATDLFAAAGLVRQMSSHHPAANLGFKGSFPVGPRGLEVLVGLEDYFVFWNEAALAPELANLLRPSEEPVGIDFLYRTSNVLLLRAGVAMRF